MPKFIIKFFLLSLFLHATLLSKDININKVIYQAEKSGKNLFVFLHKTDCGYCESMIEFTLDNDAVKSLLKKSFVVVDINIYHKDTVIYKNFKGSARAFAKMIGYDFYPSSLFFGKDKEIIFAIPGYQDEKKFFVILNYISSDSYKKDDFSTFKKEFKFDEEMLK